jgi:hypothetical protein
MSVHILIRVACSHGTAPSERARGAAARTCRRLTAGLGGSPAWGNGPSSPLGSVARYANVQRRPIWILGLTNRLHEHHLGERLARLRARVVELARLADHDGRPRAEIMVFF